MALAHPQGDVLGVIRLVDPEGALLPRGPQAAAPMFLMLGGTQRSRRQQRSD